MIILTFFRFFSNIPQVLPVNNSARAFCRLKSRGKNAKIIQMNGTGKNESSSLRECNEGGSALSGNSFREIIVRNLPGILFIIWSTFVLRAFMTRFGMPLSEGLSWLGDMFSSVKASSAAFTSLRSFSIAVWMLFSCFAPGYLILKSAHTLKCLNRGEAFIFSTALGVGALSIFVLASGALGFISMLFYTAVFTVLSFLSLFFFRELLKQYAEERDPPEKRGHGYGIIIGAILGFLALAYIIGASSPETFYDAMVYHLGAPNYFINEGRISAVPYTLHGNLPSVTGMLYLPALQLDGPAAAKYIHFLFAVLLAFSILSFAKRFYSQRAGLISTAAFFSVPMVFMNFTCAGNDGALTFFTVIALHAVMLTLNHGFPVLLSGLFAGILLGMKYTSMFSIAGFAALLILFGKGSTGKRAGNILLFAAGVCIYFFPWSVKNVLTTGDPLFPYISGLVFRDPGLLHFIKITREYYGRVSEIIVHPWALTMKGNNASSFVGPLLLSLFPVMFFRKGSHEKRAVALFVLFFWIFWMLSTKMLRFFMPVMPLLCISALDQLLEFRGERIVKLISKASIGLLLFTGIFWSIFVLYINDGWRVSLGSMNADEYLSEPRLSYPSPYYRTAGYINANLPENSRILMFGECRSFYIRRRFTTCSVYDKNPVIEAVRLSKSADYLRDILKKEGYTHLLYNDAELRRLEKFFKILYWDQNEMTVFLDFWRKHLKEVYRYGSAALYEIE